MYKSNKVAAITVAVILILTVIPAASGQTESKSGKREGAFDPVEFIKNFKIGMSYTKVQAVMPKNVEQDILSYITTEDVFMLSVDIPGEGTWNASFKFDTLDTPMRRPARLI